jgi:hypothetical protein
MWSCWLLRAPAVCRLPLLHLLFCIAGFTTLMDPAMIGKYHHKCQPANTDARSSAQPIAWLLCATLLVQRFKLGL